MITRKKQQEYIRRRWGNFLNHFESFAKRTDAHHMHEIRVELKKLRALIFLQEKAGNVINRKEKALLKKLFRAAGKVREAQVTSQFLRKANLNAKEILSAEKEKVTHYSKTFVRLVKSKTDSIVRLNTRWWRKIKRVPRKKADAIQRDLLKDIRRAFRPKLNPDRLHSSRKLIKKYVYIDSMRKRKGKVKELSAVTNRLKNLEAKIGTWHDAEIAQEVINRLNLRPSYAKKLQKISNDGLKTVRKTASETF